MSKKIKFNIFFLLILLHLSITSGKVAIQITKVNFPSPFCDPTDELVTLTFFCISCSSSSTLSSTFYFKDNNQNIIECKIPSTISDKTFQELNCKIKVPASSTSTSLFMNGELFERDETPRIWMLAWLLGSPVPVLVIETPATLP